MKDEFSESITVGKAKKDELPSIFALLDKCELPKEDLEPHLSTTLIARNEGGVVGCSVLELYQECALLAYVAVEPSFRGRGIGQRLTRAALDFAKHNHVRTVYLLTETAGIFFSTLGFEPVPRSGVPQKVQRSAEFTTLCPLTAQIMAISLTQEGPQIRSSH